MKRLLAILLTVTAIGAATPAFAQESAPGPGKVVITIIPAGATFFTEADDNTLGPSFGNYELGGSVVDAPSDSPGFREAVLADPSGVTFTISQLVR